MRTLVIGASGLVGEALYRQSGRNTVGTYFQHPRPGLVQLDIRNAQAVASLLREFRPEVVYLPAAQPNVDRCENDAAESYSINVEGTKTVAAFAREVKARLVFFSTDYVFDGNDGPYREEVPTSPMSVYGCHKLEAERAVLAANERNLVVRVCGVYGYEPAGKNFVMSFVRRVRAGQTVRVPSDQWGNPTYVEDVARAVRTIFEGGATRIWHVAAPDYLPRVEFALRICEEFDLPLNAFEGVPTSLLRQSALRPLRGGLDTTRLRRYFPHCLPRPVAEGLRAMRERWEEAQRDPGSQGRGEGGTRG